MLSSSERIFIPPESDFIPRFFLRNPDEILDESRIERILNTIFEDYRFVREWKGERPSTNDFLKQMTDQTPAAFLSTLYHLYASQYGAERWGDYNGQWLELDEIERLVEAEIAEDEYKSKFRED